MSDQSIFIVGLMAVGKSTVGRLLAQALGYEFFDTDHEIEKRAGANIAWIFDVEGEAGFRERETQVLEDLTSRPAVVVATGGGAVVRQENRCMLAARGCVLHLDSPLERLLERTAKDRKRPLLQHVDRAATLTRLREERDPLYQEIADYRFLTDRQTPKTLVRDIVRQLKEDSIV